MASNRTERRASALRDTLTGQLLMDMTKDEQDQTWLRRLAANHQKFRELREDYDAMASSRDGRRAALPFDEVSKLPQETLDAMKDALDLTEHFSWFKKHYKGLSADDLRFVSVEDWAAEATDNPKIWYEFISHVSHYASWQDAQRAEAHRKYAELTTKAQKQERKLEKQLAGIEKLKQSLTTASESVTRLQAEKSELQDRLDAASQHTRPLRDDESDPESEVDSHDRFLQGLNLGTTKETRRVRFDGRDIDSRRNHSNSSSPDTTASLNRKRSLRPPTKVDTFTGEDRDKYQEWYSKIVGQIDAYPEYFEDREDLKLNYLFQHLTGAAFDLLDNEYGPRARARNPTLTFDGAIQQLDRAYFPQDMYRTARAKLEALQMGPSESFAEFYPKFQAQIVRLQLADEHKADELTKRLTRRYAEKIFIGMEESYATIVNRLYTIDSQLQLYNSTRKGENKEGGKNAGSSRTIAGGAGKVQLGKGPSSSTGRKNHETMELGKPPKPLLDMNDGELKTYLDGLPRSKAISERCMREGRCHGCHQTGHMKSNPACPAKRGSTTSVNTTSTIAHAEHDEQGKVLA